MQCRECGQDQPSDVAATATGYCAACRVHWASTRDSRVTLATRLPDGRLGSRRTIALDTSFCERFELRELLGAGTEASVFCAVDRSLGRRVALKLLSRGHGPADVERLLEEARLLRRLEHPNILRVLDAGTTGGCAWIATELAAGGSLLRLLELEKQLPLGESLRVALDVLSALRTAHLAGVVHRDVKPANILFSASGHTKVGDFGLALQYGDEDPRDVETGKLLGTPRYMAPEQLALEPACIATDLWAVGLVLYEMLSGDVPFTGSTLQELRASHARPVRPPESVAGAWVVIDRALQSVSRRWLVASDMAEALGDIARAGGITFQDWKGAPCQPEILTIQFHSDSPRLGGLNVPRI